MDAQRNEKEQDYRLTGVKKAAENRLHGSHLMNELKNRLNTPLTLRGRTVANRLWLAPMAGLGHIAFRQVLDGFGGCGLMMTEMTSAKALPNENPKISPVFRWREEELPRLVCQLMGSQPQEMADAALRVQDEGFFGVDVNMGCSVSAIVKRRAGAALLREPDRAVEIVRAMRKAVDIPLMVKFRTGWENDPSGAVELARRFEDAGVDCLVFHPRVSPDRRSRPPVLEHLRQVCEAVDIPVIGNGNVFLPVDGLKMLDTTGCDGLSLGRMAVARPWLFSSWCSNFTPGADIHRITALAMLDALEEHYEPTRAVKLYKKYAIYLAANFSFGVRLLPKLTAGDSIEQFRENARRELTGEQALATRPNIHLFTR